MNKGNMTRFFLVRHGNTNAGDKLVGRSVGYPLSDNGREQIKALAEQHIVHKKYDKVLCSPIERTIESANILCKYIDMEPEISDNLNEIDFGEWTGKSFNELEENNKWKLFHSFRSGAKIPGGESIGRILRRILDLVLDQYELYPDGNILLVTHAEVIKLLIAHFSGIHLDNSYKIQINTGSLSILTLTDSGAFVEGINISGRIT